MKNKPSTVQPYYSWLHGKDAQRGHLLAQIKERTFGTDRRKMILEVLQLGRKIYINCEGGLGRQDPDLKVLFQHGLIEFKRWGGIPKWSKEFRYLTTGIDGKPHGRSLCASNQIRRSYVCLKNSEKN
jgi:hypothetical protein